MAQKVLILSTYERTGGAAIAANRLMQALRKSGAEVSMLCRKDISWGPRWLRKQSWTSIMERALIWVLNGFSTKDLWATDIALFGQDITKTKKYKEADVIHLHWVNQGFISLSSIKRFITDGKRVVWTMHDEWPLDGASHYYYDEHRSWLDKWIVSVKQKTYYRNKIKFVTCSQWLQRISEQKILADGQEITNIPNPIDTELFKPLKHDNHRRVLFVAQNVNDERKGIRYLDEAAKRLDDIEIIALGRDIPYIKDVEGMAKLYASFDAFMTPSLSDNLPNTIMEAMACGVPCVGFRVGGIPEMIDHKENGYVARLKDAEDLAEGIRYVLSPENHERLSKVAREKVMRCYSEESVAKRYVEVYIQDKA